MPRYFFNVYNDAYTEDEEGAELADERAARAYAVKAARSLISETVQHGYFVGHQRIEIVDEDRQPVAEVRFDEAVEVRP